MTRNKVAEAIKTLERMRVELFAQWTDRQQQERVLDMRIGEALASLRAAAEPEASSGSGAGLMVCGACGFPVAVVPHICTASAGNAAAEPEAKAAFCTACLGKRWNTGPDGNPVSCSKCAKAEPEAKTIKDLPVRCEKCRTFYIPGERHGCAAVEPEACARCHQPMVNGRCPSVAPSGAGDEPEAKFCTNCAGSSETGRAHFKCPACGNGGPGGAQ